MISNYGRPRLAGVGRFHSGWPALRGILVSGRAAAEDLRGLKSSLLESIGTIPHLAGEATVDPVALAAQVPAAVELTPHPSAGAHRLGSGLYAGKSVAWVATHDRPYLCHLADNPWASDPITSRAATRVLLGLPLREIPSSWRSAASDAGSLPPESAFEDDAFAGGLSVTRVSPDRGTVEIRREGDVLILRFPYRKALASRLQAIHGARFEKDEGHWRVPLEGAVELVHDPSCLASAPDLLRDLAERYRATTESRRKIRETLEEKRIASRERILFGLPRRYVVSSESQPGKVVCVFERNENLGNLITRGTGGRFNRKAGGYLFAQSDLFVIAETLWREGFVFEDTLIEGLREIRRQIATAAERTIGFSHPLRGAEDAPLDYEGANGLKPWKFQRADIVYGIDCIRMNGGFGAWLDMGTGKTVIATAIGDLLRQESRVSRILVLGPRSAFSAWSREVSGMLPLSFFWTSKKRGPHGRQAMIDRIVANQREAVGAVISGSKSAREEALRAGPSVVVMNYESARLTVDALSQWIDSGPPVLMICDESHYIKSHDSQTTRSVIDLVSGTHLAGRDGNRIALSGTPISNPEDAYMQTVFIDGGHERCRFGPSYQAFVHRYFHLDRWDRVKGFRSAALEREYMRLLSYCTVRRTSDEAQDLPDLVHTLWETRYEGGLEEAGYEWLRSKTEAEALDESRDESEEVDMARISLRMRQWASHPGNIWIAHQQARESHAAWEQQTAGWRDELDALLGEGARGDSPEVRRLERRIQSVKIRNEDVLEIPEDILERLQAFVASGAMPAKLASLAEYVETALADPKAKIIIACDFDYTEEAIHKALDRFNPVWYSKGTSDAERLRLEDLFQTDPSRRVFLGKAKTIHAGLTLTAARHLALYDAACGFSTTVWTQVQKRHHRGEQTQKCTVDHFVVSGTMDGYALSRVIDRAKGASRLLQDAISSLPEGLRDMVQQGREPRTPKEVARLLRSMKRASV